MKLILFLFSRNQLTVERDGIARIERGEGGGHKKTRKLKARLDKKRLKKIGGEGEERNKENG